MAWVLIGLHLTGSFGSSLPMHALMKWLSIQSSWPASQPLLVWLDLGLLVLEAGLFAMVLKQGSRPHTAALIDGLQHFGIGFSWGGYESLVLPIELDRIRTATQTPLPGPIVRLSIGLEDADDLIADLNAGLARYQAQF
jgi:hypothetical protein